VIDVGHDGHVADVVTGLGRHGGVRLLAVGGGPDRTRRGGPGTQSAYRHHADLGECLRSPVQGVAAAEAAEAGPVPLVLVAVTVKVYGVRWVRPSTVHDVVADVQVNDPGDDVTV